MLTIRNEQKEKWFQNDEKTFIEVILKKVRKQHPLYRQTDEMMRESISAGIKRAKSNELETDRQISEFVLIMFEISPNFDQQKDIRRMLDDKSLPVQERWERLFTPEFDSAWDEADSPSFYDADAWFDTPPKKIEDLEWPTREEWSEVMEIFKKYHVS